MIKEGIYIREQGISSSRSPEESSLRDDSALLSQEPYLGIYSKFVAIRNTASHIPHRVSSKTQNKQAKRHEVYSNKLVTENQVIFHYA